MKIQFDTIPDHLIKMIKSRRVIPFVGAGLSASLKLPDWDVLLKNLAEELQHEIAHSDVQKFCNNDPLQIAEYYLLVCDGRIGPMRHAISSALQNHTPIWESTAHIELVNLGAQQVYTTNYDDLIEKAFKILHQPYEVVALPKHLASAQGEKTQIVKYHGDLRYESTLVLTESSYYSRLDFESPMDLKFRSDLLGRSVLFIGYSLRDINIRIIWFKLMDMMRDIPQAERPSTYIIRYEPNPVLQKLYENVGIQTIVLDPEAEAKSWEDKTQLLNEFLLCLSSATSNDGHIPGKNDRMFASATLLNEAKSQLSTLEKTRRRPNINTRAELEWPINEIARRQYIPETREIIDELVFLYTKTGIAHRATTQIAIRALHQFGGSPANTAAIAKGLGRSDSRKIILSAEIDWAKVWTVKLPTALARSILEMFEGEIETHPQPDFADYDIAFLTESVARIANKTLLDDLSQDMAQAAKTSLQRAGAIYQSINNFTPSANGLDVKIITDEILEYFKEHSPQIIDEDPPF